MKKAVYLLSVLALAGCNEDDVKDLVEGNTKVFAVSGAQVEGINGVDDGYYDLDYITSNTSISPDEMPVGTKQDLENLNIDIEGETCGRIDIGDEGVCFKEGDSSSCVPSEVKMLGLAVYTIDLDEVKTAADHGFYPKLASDVGGLFVDIDFKEVSCSTLEAL
ncbi:hypothetical protein MD588_14100 [Photobacterium sp. SDRW27]|uniref:hypothetical protein n=1 Tax=Photobacterium obscurum TaxID=2829490 RepID=UPI002243372E|nr:hypothetical protein [Photobacterium obscurum]MCW8329937.1 hypothetical protein [Photobacterium obscurum]